MTKSENGVTTIILSNGSKFAGEKPDPIEVLLERLEKHTLDPTFEKYGNFAENIGRGAIHFHGNFVDYSHVFSIETNDPEMCAKLTAAIETNKSTSAYRAARIEKERTESRGRKR